MQPSSPETVATFTLFDRVFEWSLGATLLGSSTILAIGSAPLWVKYAAAGILWSVVVFFLALMAAWSWCMHSRPLPDDWKDLRETGVPMGLPGGWTRYLIDRLGLLLIVISIIASGRPILAGLFVMLLPASIAFGVSQNRWVFGFTRSQTSALDWAIYQTFRMPCSAIRRLFP